MTREMYDAVTPTNIPQTAAMVAGYLPPSSFTWSQSSWDRFPNAVKVRIAVRASTNDGHVLDVETGDATPVEAPGWILMRRAAGYAYPTIYCSTSVQSQVIAACNQARVALPLWWLAHYDNIDALPADPSVVAKQYADPGPVDRSIVRDFWPGVDSGADMNPTDTIPFTNNDGTVVQVPAEVVWANGNIYAGKAMTTVQDPNIGNAALAAKLDALATAVTNLTTALAKPTATVPPTKLVGTATVPIEVDLAPATAQ